MYKFPNAPPPNVNNGGSTYQSVKDFATNLVVGDIGEAKQMLADGFNIHAFDGYGNNILHKSAAQKMNVLNADEKAQLRLMPATLEKLVGLPALQELMSAQNHSGQTPMMVAIFHKNHGLLETMLEFDSLRNRGDVAKAMDKRDFMFQRPIHIAEQLGDMVAVRLLAKHGSPQPSKGMSM